MYSFRLFSFLPFFLVLFFFVNLNQLPAQHKGITVSNQDMDISFTERMDHSLTLSALTTREGSVDLMLTETELIIQFSDEGLERIHQQIHKDNDDSHFAAVIKSMVSSGVRTLLDRAMSIPLYEISEISYRDDTLIIRNREGQEIFDDLDVNGVYVMKDFARHDARQFAADAERLLD
jgi:hypothetical protein